MPMPKPTRGESYKEFTDRFMSDKNMVKEYPKTDQRYAVCMSQWKNKKKDK